MHCGVRLMCLQGCGFVLTARITMATYDEALVLDKDGSTIVFSCCAK